MRFVLKNADGRYYSGPDPDDDCKPWFASDDVSQAVVFQLFTPGTGAVRGGTGVTSGRVESGAGAHLS